MVAAAVILISLLCLYGAVCLGFAAADYFSQHPWY
jgi:hypothetical protein